MAYRIIRARGAFNYATNQGETEITAVLDSTADLSDLGTTPYRPGSVAIVADVGTPTYMLNASKVWKEV